jgi:hypothetical protein
MTIEVFIKKYQKKPIIVDAVRNTGRNVFEIGKFSEGKCKPVFTPNGYKFSVDTLEGTMEANIGDYIIKGVKGEFYPCKPDVFEATYDEYNEPHDSNHNSRPSNFSLRNLVMQVAPKHIKYYIKRLEQYGFKLYSVSNAWFSNEESYLPFITLEDKIGNSVVITNTNRAHDIGGDCTAFVFKTYNSRCERTEFEVKNNNWREAFNKLVASFPDEIMKNTNHHAGLTL